MRLHFKIMLTVVPLIVAPLILLGWVTYLQLCDTSNRSLVRDLDEVAGRFHDTVDHAFETARSNAELVGGSYLVERFLISTNDRERRELLLPEFVDEFRVIRDTYPDYRELQVIRPDGLVALRYDGDGQAALEENGMVAPHLDALSTSDGQVYHRVVPDPRNGKLTYFVAKPLRVSDPADDPNSPAARLRGFFAITVDLGFVEDLVRTTVLGQTGNVFLVDDDGKVLFHKDRARAGTSLLPEEA